MSAPIYQHHLDAIGPPTPFSRLFVVNEQAEIPGTRRARPLARPPVTPRRRAGSDERNHDDFGETLGIHIAAC